MKKPKKFKCPKCGEKFCLVDMGILLEGEQIERIKKLELVIGNNIVPEWLLKELHGKKK